MPKTTIAILGIGQPLCGDESAGLEAVRLWQKAYPDTAADPRLRVEQPGTPGMELIDSLANTGAVLLVDAVQSGAVPGTLHLVTPEQIASFGNGNGSAHGWGVAELLGIARELHYPLPNHIIILGIEAVSFQKGEPLSPAVADALAKAAEMIEDRVQWWLVM
jgi:hydrogenase maturation protease